MVNRPKYLHLLGDNPPTVETARYKATLMAYGEGGENAFEFLGPPNLMDQPADEVVDAFINYMKRGRASPTRPFATNLTVR